MLPLKRDVRNDGFHAQMCGMRPDFTRPRRQRLPVADAAAPVDECEEHGLEGVFGIGVVGKELATRGPHERSVALHEFLERRLIAVVCEPREEVGVGSAGVGSPHHGLQQRTHHR